MATKDIIEIIAVATMPIGLFAVMWHRIKMQRGLGARVIQFTAVVFVIQSSLFWPLKVLYSLKQRPHLSGP